MREPRSLPKRANKLPPYFGPRCELELFVPFVGGVGWWVF